MQRLLAMTNPKVAGIKVEDVIDNEPVHRLEKSPFYSEIVAQAKSK